MKEGLFSGKCASKAICDYNPTQTIALETFTTCLPANPPVPKKKEQDMYTTVVNNLETPTTDVARTQS